MTQTYKVQVSMNQAHIVESGFVWKQGDFGFNIEIEVLDFDVTGATPQIIFRKSSGAVEATQISVAGNKFTYAIRGTELDTPGPCICDLKLNDSTTKRVSTASFKYFVIPDTMDGLNQHADSYSDTIEQIWETLQNYSEDSEAWAKGTKGGTPVPSTAAQYNNNAKYYSDLCIEGTGALANAVEELSETVETYDGKVDGVIQNIGDVDSTLQNDSVFLYLGDHDERFYVSEGQSLSAFSVDLSTGFEKGDKVIISYSRYDNVEYSASTSGWLTGIYGARIAELDENGTVLSRTTIAFTNNKIEYTLTNNLAAGIGVIIIAQFGSAPSYNLYCYLTIKGLLIQKDIYAKFQNIENEISESHSKLYAVNKWFNGYYAANGTVSSPSASKEKYSFPIRCYEGLKIKFNLKYLTEAHDAWNAYGEYSQDGNFHRVAFGSGTSKSVEYIYEPSATANTVVFMFRGYDDFEIKVEVLSDYTTFLNNNVFDNNVLNLIKPCYDHLFVNRRYSIDIPHESLYHVRISRLLGFNCIEANPQLTSDGVFIVNHLRNGKFGFYFHHVDGITDISDISVSSVTWAWIVENVRYNSRIEKYQTRPCRLEEFLQECKQQNLIPFIGNTNYWTVVNMANKILGPGNYIAYDAERYRCPYAPIYKWASLTTKEDILAYCHKYGAPFIYGMSNPTAFTDEQLKEIIGLLHENGYKIATSYADNDWSKYISMGFDFNGTLGLVNRIENGNICNFETIDGFDDFEYTNATETDGVLTFQSDGTISPEITNDVYPISGADIEIDFIGSITLSAIGEIDAVTFTSGGDVPVFICPLIVKGSPKFEITATSGTIIKDIKFKASRF